MTQKNSPDLLKVRDFCLGQLIQAYEEAGILGLCGEGRWEYALDRVRQLSQAELLEAALLQMNSSTD